MNAARLSSTAFDLTLWLYLGAMVLSFAYLAALDLESLALEA